jgi:integrase
VGLLFAACGFHFVTDIDKQKVETALSRKRKAGSSPRTINLWQSSAKAFLNWMLEEKRITANPLSGLKAMNESTDIRVDRRAFTVEELERLLAAAKRSGVVNGMSGGERAVLYLLAVNTGLRWSELRSLIRSSFNFENEPPIVTIDAKFAKNKKTDDIPLNPDVALTMKAFVEGREPLDKVFQTMWQKHGAAMLRADLETAGIPYKDANGRRRDFHSLRHTFGTLLGKADVTLVYVQKCMRHSDPKLTVRYTDVGLDDKSKSIARLPKIKDRTQSGKDNCDPDR